VRPRSPNARADFLHEEGFAFAEVDLEKPTVLFFTRSSTSSRRAPARAVRKTGSRRR
jgi:hypothetical protein